MAEDRSSGHQFLNSTAGGYSRVHNGDNFISINVFMRNEPEIPEQGLQSSQAHNEVPTPHYDDAVAPIRFATQQDTRERRLLHSLFFNDITTRQDSVRLAAPGTLDWIFEISEQPSLDSDDGGKEVDEDGEDDEGSEDEEDSDFESFHTNESSETLPEDNFAQWLREGSSIYWICGKAGSGKSTLMAYVVEDHRTIEYLKHWSAGEKLIVISFFFWRPGAGLQNSITGLLRSLLYQICRTSASATTAVLDSVGEEPPIWTDRRLIRAVATAVLGSSEYFCVFIDGLDEYCGDYNDLLDLLTEFERPPNVKACVSGRPEPTFLTRLSDCKQMHLERRNASSILEFVKAKLEPYSIERKDGLVSRVAVQAQGVFLWAELVTQSLVKGILHNDTLQMLFERLEHTPVEMNALLSHMFESIDQRYKESLRFFLRVMKLKEKYPTSSFNVIAYIAAARIPGKLATYGAFERVCNGIALQIWAHSSGLLEVRRYAHRSAMKAKKLWAEADYKFAVPRLQGFGNNDVQLDGNLTYHGLIYGREQIEPETEFPSFLSYEHLFVDWVHRSAYDFVMSNGNLLELEYDLDESTVLDSMLTGMLHYIFFAPACHRAFERLEREFCTYDRTSAFMDIMHREYLFDPTRIAGFIDKLYDLMTHMQPEEFERKEVSYCMYASYENMPGITMTAIYFWIECFKTTALMGYVNARFDRWTCDTDGNYLINPLSCTVKMLLTEEWAPPYSPPLFRINSFSCRQAAIAMLRPLQHVIQANPSTVFVRRRFFRNHTVYSAALGSARRHFDALDSVSCSWPRHKDQLELASGHAMAIFTLVAVFMNASERRQRLSEGYQEIFTILCDLLEFFNPSWNIMHRTGGPDPYFNTPEPWRPDHVRIEGSYHMWRNLFKYMRGEIGKDGCIRQHPRLYIVCLPQGMWNSYERPHSPELSKNDYENEQRNDYENSLREQEDGQGPSEERDSTTAVTPTASRLQPPYVSSQFKNHIEIFPSVPTSSLFLEALMDGLCPSLQGDFQIRLSQYVLRQLLIACTALIGDIRTNRQGLDAGRQQEAIICVQAEVSALRERLSTRPSRDRLSNNVWA